MVFHSEHFKWFWIVFGGFEGILPILNPFDNGFCLFSGFFGSPKPLNGFEVFPTNHSFVCLFLFFPILG